MIDLVNAEGKKLKIEVLDYEFPNREDTGGLPTEEELAEMEGGRDYDANWLMLKLTGEDGTKHWEAVDPFLLTWELESIMEWFVYMAEGIQKENISLSLFFTDTCFALYQKEEEDGVYKIRFALSYELAPEDQPLSTEYYMDFLLTRAELAKVADSIALTLAQFPER